jgi:hypothetical protein
VQPVEEFMQEFFRARTQDIREELKRAEPFRKRFFSEGCSWGCGKDSVRKSESEHIIGVTRTDNSAEVITDYGFGFETYLMKLRYHLKSPGGNWLIDEVDLECMTCRKKLEKRGCQICEGTGWVVTNSPLARARIESFLEGETDEPEPRKKDTPPEPPKRF